MTTSTKKPAVNVAVSSVPEGYKEQSAEVSALLTAGVVSVALSGKEVEHLLHALSCIESELPEHYTLIQKLNKTQGKSHE